MRFHHYGIEVNNLEESIAFYKNYFGLLEECRMVFMEEEIVFLASESGNFRLELIFCPQNSSKTTHLCFEVSDIQEVMGRLDPGRLMEGPYKLENGWETVFFEGPGQELIEFLQVGSDS